MTKMLDIPKSRPRARAWMLCLLMALTLLAVWGAMQRPTQANARPGVPATN